MQSKFLIYLKKIKKKEKAQHTCTTQKIKLGEILKRYPEKVDGFKWQILMPKEKFQL